MAPTVEELFPDLYKLDFREGCNPEESKEIAELLNVPGWQIMVRLLSAEVRKYEIVMQDPMVAKEQKLALLDRWAAARDFYKVFRHAPEQASRAISSQVEATENSDAPPSPRFPLGPHATPNHGLTRIK